MNARIAINKIFSKTLLMLGVFTYEVLRIFSFFVLRFVFFFSSFFFTLQRLSRAVCIGERNQSQEISSVQETERGMTHLPAIVSHSHVHSKTHTQHTHKALQALSLCVNSTLSGGGRGRGRRGGV